VLSTGHPSVREEWLMKSDGNKVCLEMLRAPYFDFDGAPLGLISIGRDISERRRLEEQMRLSALVYQHTAEGMLVTDANYRIIDINAAGARITGYQLDEVRGQRPDIFNSGRQDLAFYELMQRTVDEFGYWHGEVEDRRKNGDTYAKSMVINRLMGGDGTVHGYVMLFSDITEKKQADEMIWRQANFDMLTGLPNRRMLRERLEHEIRQTTRAGCSLALLLIDLDHFKEVNDTLGHLVGDDLLVEAARRISACTRESDTVARLGGDEFTVILTRITDPKHVETVAEKIITHLAEPFQLGDSVAYISASVGVTLCPDDADEAEALLKNADQAMYVAKRQGRNRFSHFTQGLQTAAQDRLRMISDLRSAIKDKQFHLQFQPIVDPITGHICKAEALLRWDHPIHGVVLPGDFIPLAEETGMIVSIGDWVFREAARWASRWNRLVPGGFQISVNASPVQFRPEAAATLRDWITFLHNHDIPGSCMVIEITEGLLLNADADVSQILLALRMAGIQMAIDDFGTGYSSLAYLNKFDIEFLKIDQSFISSLSAAPADRALCEAIIVMAHKLSLQVIAEGVETAEQRNLLREAACDFLQGYLLSRPITPEQLEAVLKHGATIR
jgi:diguanylate cyclase (GGDEF)-like protein/PAS domain S-box-containing protein